MKFGDEDYIFPSPKISDKDKKDENKRYRKPMHRNNASIKWKIAISKTKYVGVLDKSISLGAEGILATDIKNACCKSIKGKIQSFIVGLGGKDITGETIAKCVNELKKADKGCNFIY